MVPKQYRLTVVSNKEIAEGIFFLSVKAPEKIAYHAGQYFSFKIADKVNRSYSVASSPEDETLDFLVELIEGGVGSNFVKNLKPGDEFDALGPLGFFTLEKTGAVNENGQLIFAATGSGITPMRSMIRHLLLELKSTRKISLYFGLRYDNHIYLHEEFEELAKQFSNFSFTPLISRPSDNWKGIVGYCQDCIKQYPADPEARIFICGGNRSVEGISSDLIAHGYPKERVHFEKFG